MSVLKERKYIFKYNSPMCLIFLESDGTALIGLWLEGQRDFDEMLLKEYEEKDLPVFRETVKWLDIYFQGKKPDFMPPLCLEGSAFQKKVWEILLTIPYGKTMTYGEIADQIAMQKGIKKMSAQAVGGAVGRNPVSIIVPCHRVIGAGGKMTGYAGGIDKKIELLTLEKYIAE